MSKRFVLALLAVGTCGASSQCPGTLKSSDLTGSGTMSGASVPTLQSTAFSWYGRSPTQQGGTVSFAFELDSADGHTKALLTCYPPSLSAITGLQPAPLTSLACYVSVEAAGTMRYFDVTTGTALGVSTLDSQGNGTLTITIDMPSATLPAHEDAGTLDTLTANLNGLTGTATFETQSCPQDCNCGGGLNPVI